MARISPQHPQSASSIKTLIREQQARENDHPASLIAGVPVPEIFDRLLDAFLFSRTVSGTISVLYHHYAVGDLTGQEGPFLASTPMTFEETPPTTPVPTRPGS